MSSKISDIILAVSAPPENCSVFVVRSTSAVLGPHSLFRLINPNGDPSEFASLVSRPHANVEKLPSAVKEDLATVFGREVFATQAICMLHTVMELGITESFPEITAVLRHLRGLVAAALRMHTEEELLLSRQESLARAESTTSVADGGNKKDKKRRRTVVEDFVLLSIQFRSLGVLLQQLHPNEDNKDSTVAAPGDEELLEAGLRKLPAIATGGHPMRAVAVLEWLHSLKKATLPDNNGDDEPAVVPPEWFAETFGYMPECCFSNDNTRVYRSWIAGHSHDPVSSPAGVIMSEKEVAFRPFSALDVILNTVGEGNRSRLVSISIESLVASIKLKVSRDGKSSEQRGSHILQSTRSYQSLMMADDSLMSALEVLRAVMLFAYLHDRDQFDKAIAAYPTVQPPGEERGNAELAVYRFIVEVYVSASTFTGQLGPLLTWFQKRYMVTGTPPSRAGPLLARLHPEAADLEKRARSPKQNFPLLTRLAELASVKSRYSYGSRYSSTPKVPDAPQHPLARTAAEIPEKLPELPTLTKLKIHPYDNAQITNYVKALGLYPDTLTALLGPDGDKLFVSETKGPVIFEITAMWLWAADGLNHSAREGILNSEQLLTFQDMFRSRYVEFAQKFPAIKKQGWISLLAAVPKELINFLKDPPGASQEAEAATAAAADSSTQGDENQNLQEFFELSNVAGSVDKVFLRPVRFAGGRKSVSGFIESIAEIFKSHAKKPDHQSVIILALQRRLRFETAHAPLLTAAGSLVASVVRRCPSLDQIRKKVNDPATSAEDIDDAITKTVGAYAALNAIAPSLRPAIYANLLAFLRSVANGWFGGMHLSACTPLLIGMMLTHSRPNMSVFPTDAMLSGLENVSHRDELLGILRISFDVALNAIPAEDKELSKRWASHATIVFGPAVTAFSPLGEPFLELLQESIKKARNHPLRSVLFGMMHSESARVAAIMKRMGLPPFIAQLAAAISDEPLVGCGHRWGPSSSEHTIHEKVWIQLMMQTPRPMRNEVLKERMATTLKKMQGEVPLAEGESVALIAEEFPRLVEKLPECVSNPELWQAVAAAIGSTADAIKLTKLFLPDNSDKHARAAARTAASNALSHLQKKHRVDVAFFAKPPAQAVAMAIVTAIEQDATKSLRGELEMPEIPQNERHFFQDLVQASVPSKYPILAEALCQVGFRRFLLSESNTGTLHLALPPRGLASEGSSAAANSPDAALAVMLDCMLPALVPSIETLMITAVGGVAVARFGEGRQIVKARLAMAKGIQETDGSESKPGADGESGDLVEYEDYAEDDEKEEGEEKGDAKDDAEEEQEEAQSGDSLREGLNAGLVGAMRGDNAMEIASVLAGVANDMMFNENKSRVAAIIQGFFWHFIIPAAGRNPILPLLQSVAPHVQEITATLDSMIRFGPTRGVGTGPLSHGIPLCMHEDTRTPLADRVLRIRMAIAATLERDLQVGSADAKQRLIEMIRHVLEPANAMKTIIPGPSENEKKSIEAQARFMAYPIIRIVDVHASGEVFYKQVSDALLKQVQRIGDSLLSRSDAHIKSSVTTFNKISIRFAELTKHAPGRSFASRGMGRGGPPSRASTSAASPLSEDPASGGPTDTIKDLFSSLCERLRGHDFLRRRIMMSHAVMRLRSATDASRYGDVRFTNDKELNLREAGRVADCAIQENRLGVTDFALASADRTDQQTATVIRGITSYFDKRASHAALEHRLRLVEVGGAGSGVLLPWDVCRLIAIFVFNAIPIDSARIKNFVLLRGEEAEDEEGDDVEE